LVSIAQELLFLVELGRYSNVPDEPRGQAVEARRRVKKRSRNGNGLAMKPERRVVLGLQRKAALGVSEGRASEDAVVDMVFATDKVPRRRRRVLECFKKER